MLTGLPEEQLVKWINLHIVPRMKAVEKLTDLRDGDAYLLIAANICPDIICATDIIFNPTNLWDIYRNFQILKRGLRRKDSSCFVNVQQLTHANPSEHLKLSLFLYQTFNQKVQNNLLINKPFPQQELPFQSFPRFGLQTKVKDYDDSKRYQSNLEKRTRASSNLISMSSESALKLSQSFQNIIKIVLNDNLNYYSFLRHITINHLQSKKSDPLSDQLKHCIKKSLSVRKSFRTFQYLFYGQASNHQDIEQYEQTRTQIRKNCRKYYQSIKLIKELVGNHLRKMKYKMMTILYLHKIELLTQKKLTKKEFQAVNKEELAIEIQPQLSNFEDSFNNMSFDGKIVEKSSNDREPQLSIVKIKPSIAKKQAKSSKKTVDFSTQGQDQGETEKFETINCQDDLISNSNQYTQLQKESCSYWTIHRLTLIGYQLHYVHHKDPNYLQDDPLFYKRTEHTKFMTGLMLCQLKKNKITKTVNFISELNKYSRLKYLINNPTNANEARLGELVRIMLSIKHTFIFGAFAAAYEKILTEIEGVAFEDVKTERKRLEFVERVTRKLKKNSAEIARMLKQSLQLEEEGDVIDLMRATVYCFLAELFGFSVNEYWPIVFKSGENERKEPDDKLE